VVDVAPPPSLLQRLARRRLNVPRAGTFGGVGEHRSSTLGPGLEFAEYRAYQPGDDLRRVDPHLEARSGELFVREGDLLEQLAVTVVVDMSESMGGGAPEKSLLARRAAGALAYVALAGTDRVRLVAFTGRGLRWGPRGGSVRAAGQLFEWLGGLRAEGAVEFDHAAKALAARLPRPGLCLVVSDWLFAAPEAGLGVLRAARQEVVGVQVCSPEELDPSALATGGLGGGALTLEDVETGAEVNVALTPAALAVYARNLRRWQEGLEAAFVRHGGTWLRARSDADLEALLLKEWAGYGLVR
jgi:uncharacterized protein (DUF58 family)